MMEDDNIGEDLCHNHRLFVAEWFKNGRNGTQAYRHVYGADTSDKVASVCASQILALPKVKALIERKVEEINIAADISAVWALKNRVEIVERCMQARPVINTKGKRVMITSAEGNLVPAYVFDAGGANAALLAIEKIHLGMTEKGEIDTTMMVVIKNYKDVVENERDNPTP